MDRNVLEWIEMREEVIKSLLSQWNVANTINWLHFVYLFCKMHLNQTTVINVVLSGAIRRFKRWLFINHNPSISLWIQNCTLLTFRLWVFSRILQQTQFHCESECSQMNGKVRMHIDIIIHCLNGFISTIFSSIDIWHITICPPIHIHEPLSQLWRLHFMLSILTLIKRSCLRSKCEKQKQKSWKICDDTEGGRKNPPGRGRANL